MDSWNSSFSLFSFFILLLSFSTSTVTLSPFEDIACSFVNCGEGTCKASNNSLLGFDCECKSGWKKIKIGRLKFPSCVIPNCTVDFHCGKGPPSPPPPSAPLPPPPPPPPNQTNHCDQVWCGDGKCVTNGTRHICQCNQGSENLFNSHRLACFKPCYFGGDCEGLGLNLPLKRSHPPPPPTSSSSNGNGLKGLGTLCRLTVIVVLAACLPWI